MHSSSAKIFNILQLDLKHFRFFFEALVLLIYYHGQDSVWKSLYSFLLVSWTYARCHTVQPVLCALLKQKESQAFWEFPWLTLQGAVKFSNNQTIILSLIGRVVYSPLIQRVVYSTFERASTWSLRAHSTSHAWQNLSTSTCRQFLPSNTLLQLSVNLK